MTACEKFLFFLFNFLTVYCTVAPNRNIEPWFCIMYKVSCVGNSFSSFEMCCSFKSTIAHIMQLTSNKQSAWILRLVLKSENLYCPILPYATIHLSLTVKLNGSFIFCSFEHNCRYNFCLFYAVFMPCCNYRNFEMTACDGAIDVLRLKNNAFLWQQYQCLNIALYEDVKAFC